MTKRTTQTFSEFSEDVLRRAMEGARRESLKMEALFFGMTDPTIAEPWPADPGAIDLVRGDDGVWR